MRTKTDVVQSMDSIYDVAFAGDFDWKSHQQTHRHTLYPMNLEQPNHLSCFYVFVWWYRKLLISKTFAKLTTSSLILSGPIRFCLVRCKI